MTTIQAAGSIGAAEPCTWVRIENGVIADLGVRRPGPATTELAETLIAPALCDLQVNGIGPVSFSDPDRRSWEQALADMLREGVATCLPTIVSRSLDDYDELFAVARSLRAQSPPDRSRLAGLHLEGPFLARPGAHDPDLLRPVDTRWIAELLERHGDLVRLVTLAPEVDPGFEGTRLLSRAGVTVSIGHTEADYDTVIGAAEAGAQMSTHLFNAMAPLHHRAPGPVGAALDRLVPSLIADLAHVHPAVLRFVVRACERTVVVSDRVGGVELTLDHGAYLDPRTRVLAGSATPLFGGFANLVRIGVDPATAVAAVSTTPHEMIGERNRGRIVRGAPADLVAIEPTSARLVAVWRNGHRVDLS